MNTEIQERVEYHSEKLSKIVEDIASKYTEEADTYIQKIKDVLEDSGDLTIEDLNRILVRLTTYAYFFISKQELASLRASISELVYDEKFNESYMNLQGGTIASKTARAEEMAKEEAIVKLVYGNVYKIIKGKCSAIERLSDAVKKIISAKMQEWQIAQKEL